MFTSFDYKYIVSSMWFYSNKNKNVTTGKNVSIETFIINIPKETMLCYYCVARQIHTSKYQDEEESA